MHLLKHLSPAFVRISGPSNHNVVFVEGRNAFGGAQDGATIPVTPTMWQSLNVWFKMANLTPVYAIDEHDRIGGVWDPRRTMPFFRISDRMNLSTYWQLGCGKAKVSETRVPPRPRNLMVNVVGNNTRGWQE